MASATGGSAATQAVDADARRWNTRRGTAFAIRAVAFLAPFLASFLVARLLQEALPSAHSLLGHAVRWGVVIAGSTSVLVAADRVTRHLLPIAALFRVALVFPDRAPSRYTVALRSGSSKSLAARVRAGGDLGDTPAEAAENALVLLKDLGRHDRLTRGHSERVRAYSEIIAEEMELPAGDREKLRWAALIHDVGKMAVSPEILNKPGRPTDEEWQELRTHPAAGARMLAPLEPWLGEWIGAATEHHERFDGKGYPLGLAGHDITLAGRLVAVADAFDCMTSARSYKQVLPPEQARFELSRNAGTQFDPEVVRAFLNISVGRLHLAGGPLAWLSSIPGVREVATGLTGAAATTSGAIAATGLAVVAATAALVPFSTPQPRAERPPIVVTPAGASDDAEAGSSAGDDGTSMRTDRSDRTPSTTSSDDESGARGVSTTTTRPGSVGPPRTTSPATTAPPHTSPPPPSPTTTRPPPSPTTSPPTTGPGGRPPAPENDNRAVRGGTTEDLDVLSNDVDPDGDLRPSSLRIVSAPAFGSASVSGSKIRFDAPTVETARRTELHYRICDAGGRCGDARLRVVVTP